MTNKRKRQRVRNAHRRNVHDIQIREANEDLSAYQTVLEAILKSDHPIFEAARKILAHLEHFRNMF